MGIRVFLTGGTIAKYYDEISGDLYFDDAHFEKMLKESRCQEKISVTKLMLKDSLEMTASDRACILQAISSAKEERIMIAHGTDTMVKTAETLSQIEGKTIVLFGAMIPFALKNSDALFNLGCAIGALSLLNSGVYVVMNGKVFPWDGVEKNREKGIFIER